tara:strand:- start:236 stop:991 length:756 start_codon:yes stop_codon:yes gene_type:complete
MKLKEKVAVVTGGASGFGRAICEKFVKEGAHVVICDLDSEKGKLLAHSLGGEGKAIFKKCDVTDLDSLRDLFEIITDRYHHIDIMVNNAGYTHTKGSLVDVSEEEFDKVFSVNVKALYRTTKLSFPLLKLAQKPVIINIASTAAVRPRPDLTWYNASKGAVVTATKSMAIELAPHNIRVCAINPVMGETGMLEKFMGVPDTEKNRKTFLSTIPLGRFSTPDDIANAALYLSSDDASMVTGISLEIDGGRCI